MKIAVVGCGALGSYYGAKLCRDGHEVHFLLRSDYETVQKNGVQIFSVDGNFVVRPHCALKPEEIGQCDLVLIGIKTTGNEQLKKLLPPLTGEKTMCSNCCLRGEIVLCLRFPVARPNCRSPFPNVLYRSGARSNPEVDHPPCCSSSASCHGDASRWRRSIFFAKNTGRDNGGENKSRSGCRKKMSAADW